MKLFVTSFLLTSNVLVLSGCGGAGDGAGHWFHFIFIIIPLFIGGYILMKRTETINDYLSTMDGQIKRLSSRLDSIEEKIKKPKST